MASWRHWLGSAFGVAVACLALLVLWSSFQMSTFVPAAAATPVRIISRDQPPDIPPDPDPQSVVELESPPETPEVPVGEEEEVDWASLYWRNKLIARIPEVSRACAIDLEFVCDDVACAAWVDGSWWGQARMIWRRPAIPLEIAMVQLGGFPAEHDQCGVALARLRHGSSSVFDEGPGDAICMGFVPAGDGEEKASAFCDEIY